MNPIMNLLMTMSGTWSMDTFLTNVQGSMESWGQILIMIVGIVMVIAGVVKLAMGMMNSGRGQTNWILTIGLIVVGGILAFAGGWDMLVGIGQGAKNTLDDLGTGVILSGMLR